MKTRILLADDHSLMRIGLTSLINGEKDLSVVGEAENGAEAVAKCRELKPDVVIMDLMMPGMSGAEAVKAIRAAELPSRILILTSYGTSMDLAVALENGADGVLLKDTAPNELLDGIRTVAAGGELVPPVVRNLLEESTAATRLTDRQRVILESVTRGLGNREIARQIGVSEITVKKQLEAIFQCIGAANRTEAAAIALRLQLLKA